MNDVSKVIQVALAEEGYLEKSKSAYLANPKVLYSKTDGAGSDNYTKYGKEMHDIYPSVMDFPAYWCDCFVDWCFQKAYGVANAKGLLGGNFDDYTKNSIRLYMNKNAMFYRGEKEPTIGDQIFFTKDNTYNGVHHTALVINVDNSFIYTIEGNTSNGSEVVPNGGSVCRKKYPKLDGRIYCYGRPKYDVVTTQPKNGWIKESNNWYYYENNIKQVKKWIKYEKHWYRLGNDGHMLTGWHQIADDKNVLSWCYFEVGDRYPDLKGAEWHERKDGYLEIWTTK